MSIVRSFLAGLIFATTGALVAQTPASPVAEEKVTLPAVTVNEEIKLLAPEAWRYAQIRDLEILSNAGDRETTTFVQNFWRFRSYFQQLFPRTKHLPPLPVVLVLRARGNFLRQDEGIFRSADADVGVFVVDPRTETGESDLQREYASWAFDRLSPKPPAWFVAGMVKLCSRLQFSPDEFRFTKLDESFGDYFYFADEGGKGGRTIIPLERLFGARSLAVLDSPLDPEIFANQSFAFIHLCLYSRGGKLHQPFAEWVKGASPESFTEKRFQEIFHRSYNAMGAIIRAHVTDVKYTGEPTKLPVGVESVAFDLRDATEAEVGRIKGDGDRLAGRLGDARLELLSPYLRGHSDPRLLASLGILNRAEKNDPAARNYFVRAVAEKIAAPGPYLYLAQMRFNELTAPGAEPLTPAQASELFELLGTAGALPPARADVYQLLADIWLHTQVPPRPENLVVFNDAARAFPQESAFVLAAVRARMRAGQTSEAKALAELGLRFATDEPTKLELAQLKNQLAR